LKITFDQIFCKTTATFLRSDQKSKIFVKFEKISTKDFLKTYYVTSIANALQKLFLDEFQEEKKEVFKLPNNYRSNQTHAIGI